MTSSGAVRATAAGTVEEVRQTAVSFKSDILAMLSVGVGDGN